VGAEDAKQPQTGGDFLPRDSYLAIGKRELYTNFNEDGDSLGASYYTILN
jgi:hypothetical protein